MIRKMLWIAFAAIALLAGNASAQSGATVTIDLAALNGAFDRQTITVPAYARVVLHFENRDRIPHNVSVYENERAVKVIYYGRIINGLQDVQYEFTAPAQPGTYFFRCDLHPRGMIGDFVVE
jgi:plastocyanin